jgi:hypothetical protein
MATGAEFSIPAGLDYQDVLATARDHFFALDPNIVGVGIGPRRVGGKIVDDQMALVFMSWRRNQARRCVRCCDTGDIHGIGHDVHPPFSAAAPTTTVNFVSEHEIGDDLANLDWVRVHEFITAAAAPRPSPTAFSSRTSATCASSRTTAPSSAPRRMGRSS